MPAIDSDADDERPEEAAEISGCAVGTIKSRVNRARNRLGEMLGMDDTGTDEPGIKSA